MGSRAFSHDSIFIPDGRTESEQAIQAMSQENVLGKVKILQQQLAKNIKFRQPPQMTISARTMGEANASTEDDALLSSPMETESQQDTVISDCSNKVTPMKSARPKRQFSCSGTIETINLDSVPQALARLDNSAAKHKLSVKPKKQRMSRQHKRLTKGSQSLTITEFEPEDLETQLYEDIYPGYNGRFTADKLIQDRDEQKQLQLAEEKRIEDHWGILEAERIRQIVEMEEQREMEEKRCQELEEMRKEQEKERCEEDRRQHLLDEETLKIEEQTCHKDERRLMKAEKKQELEEQMQKELEEQQRQNLEKKRHWEAEEQQRRELEEQKLKEQQEQRQELEVQKLKEQEEQQRQELDEQKLKEPEEQRQELEVQKLKEQEEQQRRELEEQKLKERQEQQRQELEEQKLKEQEEQQRQELEEQKLKEQEEQRQELEVQKLKEQEEHQRRELDGQRHQQREEQQRLKQEEEKNQEQREQQRRELEERKHLEQEEQRRQELEGEKHQEWEEQKHKDLEEKERQELEEQKRLEPKELKQHRTEKDSQKEEERNWLEEQTELKKENKEEIQQQELEEKEFEEVEIKLKREKEPESLKQEKKQEEQRQHLKEKEKTEKEQSQQVTDKKKKREEQRKHKLTKQMHMESSDCVLQDELKQQKEQNGHEQKVDTEGQNLQPKQEKSLEQPQEKDQLCSAGGAARHPAEEKFQEGSSFQKVKQPEKGTKTAEEILAQKLKKEVEAQEQKRIGEELRWQEVDERQMSSRPFTFQVSSGDKQIIFQKVNLSPVMPIKGAGLSSPSVKDCRVHTTSKGSHSLPSSVCVPHTAILVTGAQLCGTAVNLNQIKDTACKSLLGLTEERKNVDIPSPEKSERKKQDPKPSSSKMKHAQEALNNQAVLAEWASIRSRILKNAENNKYNERDRVTACRHSDDWTPRGRGAPHGNLRKTLSANAKFSITPAWQKFSDISKTSSDAENVNVTKGNETVAVGRTTGSSADSKEDVVSTVKDNLTEKPKEKMETHREVTDNTEGCKFAKDLPSFLVPSFPHSMGKELPQPELPNALENQQSNSTKKADKPPPNGEENVSPFGIKLRRTNYSLRFHYDQQAEQKKKKRYSAGDSFDGVPDPITSTEGEKESSVFTPQESTSPGTGRANIPGNLKESSVTVVEFSAPVGTPVVPPATGQSVLPAHEKPACKSLVPQKPALAPKPTSQTPPSSPLSKMNRSNLSEMLGQRVAKAESDGGWRKEDKANAAQPVPSNDYKNEEEEVKEKKSFFPSLSIPWREKNDKKPEPLKKEKPVLQSRHSVDGSKLLEKVETSQPLWITLALQKQKGFREQQATREERRQAREAKQAEKLAKENAAVSNQSDNKSSSSKTSTLQKSTTQEGEKKIETAVSRLERREHLKKSNTLPTSVTVEISDSVPTTPVTKEVAKRFSTPDANPVSTEPAWLALAKRKAKAWSDCPQIIK
ncbi:capping protein-inhibiting regulator of actin dynamics isoform X2 [Haemorhous mexicanus]|uniref:capping protein-inhibiting regulator of actin dynamics isoform X2 n=1 Tax=Haemorhous mexicanus TaxID=30427 RepID=UPI0028BE1B0A|nr:capping protein-inhibiting regulator of actin dynamics isoform X2 [Haemorhous mexicanus]